MRTDGQGKGIGSNDGSRSASLCKGSSVTEVGVKAEDVAWVGEGRSWWTSLALQAVCLCGHNGNPQRLLLTR